MSTHLMFYQGVWYRCHYEWYTETFDGEYGAWIIDGTIWDQHLTIAA